MALEGVDLETEVAHARVTAALLGVAPRNVRLGRFEPLRQLGQGAMGSVYEARDSQRGETVAVKCLDRVDGRGVAHFKREFRSLSWLLHPNLVVLHELCCEDGRWFFSMERVDGVSFQRWVRPNQQLDAHRLRDALSQLARGVMAVHAAGKLHCDLKPGNVLVTSQGRVVVLDFGLAAEISLDGHPESACSGLIGTPAYLAPEQAAGEPASAASDWYAIGAMLFEALTGALPFEGNPLAVLRDKQATEAPDPQTLCDGLPEDLRALCAKLLRRNARERLGGAALLTALGHSQRRAPSASPPAQPVFVGRERELAAIAEGLHQARSGTSRVILLGACSGMGKTALLARFARSLDQEVLVLHGRCHEHESVPYKVFDAVVDSLARHLRKLPEAQQQALLPRHADALLQLFPVLGLVHAWPRERAADRPPEDPREQRNRAFAALKELLLRLTDRGPVVIMVDDLQWGDADSARMLAYVLGPPEPPPLLLLGAYRSEEVGTSEFLKLALAEKTDGLDLRPTRLELGPLDLDASVELARTLLGDDHDARATLLAREAQGLPFFLTELAQHLNERTQRAEHNIPAGSLEHVIMERVASMPEGSQRLLQVLSVAGGPIEHTVAARAADLGASGFDALRMLCNARLARSSGPATSALVETYHDRVRETVSARIDFGVSRAIHLAIADALELAGIRDAERLFVHYKRAGDIERAGAAAESAARLAVDKLAFNRAAELFEKAIELLPQDDPNRGELHVHLGDALANAGRGAQAAEAYLRATEGLQGADARRLQRMAAQQYLRSGRIQEGTELARRLFREAGLIFPETFSQTILSYGWNKASLRLSGYRYHDGPDTPPTAVTLERLATIDATFREVGFIDLTRGAALQAQFLRYAQRARDSQRVMHGLAWQAWSAAMTNRSPKPALRILSEVEDLARHIGTPYAAATAKSARAGCALFLRRLSEVVGPATEAEQIFREHCAGTHWEQNAAAAYRYTAIEQIGGFKTILQEAPARARDAMDKDDRYGTAFLTLFVTFSHLVLDRPEEAMRFLDEERARLSGSYGAFHLWVAIRTVHALLYSGDGPGALHFIESETQRFKASACSRGRYYATTMRSLMARCLLAAAKNDRRARPALVRRAQRLARTILGMSQPHTEALGLLLLAEAARKIGDDERASKLLTSCMNGADRHQAPILSTYAQRSLGSLLGGTEGSQLAQRADCVLKSEGVRAPDRWTRIWIDMARD